MLRGMSAQQLLEWQSYARIEPFGEWWATQRTASVLQFHANRSRDPRKAPQPLKDFVLEFKEQETAPAKKQTWQEQKMIAQILVAAYNTEPEGGEEKTGPKKGRGRRR